MGRGTISRWSAKHETWLAWLQRRRSAVGAGDDGFSIVDVIVALFLLSATSIPIAYSVSTSMQVSSLAQQRFVGAEIVNQTIQDVEALPYSAVADGLNAANVATNPSPDLSETTAGTWIFTPTGEVVPTSAPAGSEPPLVPFASAVRENGVSYSVATYPMWVATGTSLIRIVVSVSWQSSPNGSNQVRGQTLLYDPSSSSP